MLGPHQGWLARFEVGSSGRPSTLCVAEDGSLGSAPWHAGITGMHHHA